MFRELAHQDGTWGRKYPLPGTLGGKGQAMVHALAQSAPCRSECGCPVSSLLGQQTGSKQEKGRSGLSAVTLLI